MSDHTPDYYDQLQRDVAFANKHQREEKAALEAARRGDLDAARQIYAPYKAYAEAQQRIAALEEDNERLEEKVEDLSAQLLDCIERRNETVGIYTARLLKQEKRNAALEMLVRCADELLAGSEPVLARIYDGGDTRDWVYKDDWRDEAAKLLEVGDV